MKPFLKVLAEYAVNEFGEKGLENLSFVFPNRRSGVFFKHYLLETGKGTFWLPEVITINEFISGLSTLETADPIDLSFELYRIYKKLAVHPESYDEFYYWGEMLINDFDDLDKYLVHAEKLFKNIVDLKEIEEVFGGFEESQLEVIREFWSHFGTGLSPEKKNFVDMWKLLFPLYAELNENLRKKGIGYEGMLYREVAESIIKKDFGGIKKDKVIIAGFNALNNAERAIFRFFKESGKGLFFWDYDEEYVFNTIPEAGRFLRKNLQVFPPVETGETFNHLKKEKKIKIFDLPSDLLQCKQLGKILNSEQIINFENFDNTAVILGDETLLEPVMSSLPDNIPVNITMGYPLSHTPVFSFTNQLLKLQKNLSKQTNQKSSRFYHLDVLDVLNHQYMRYIIDNEIRSLIHLINSRNMIYVKQELFKNNLLLAKIFRKVESALDMTAYLREILEEVLSLFLKDENSETGNAVEKEYAFHIITRLNKLETIFLTDPPDTGTDTFSRLFRKVISNSRIPFQGEPLRGLQIMGILESRLLDFNNVILLSMNEGVMPRAHTSFSFIPANLRYAFGMPGREDHDAIYAYYFYRLIQRAENINILYNSKTDGLNSGEKSRYLYQLEYLSSYKPVIKTVSFHISGKEALPILMGKNPLALIKLNEYTILGRKALSPTAINTWIDCKLKFYFTYVAGIREEMEVSEEIDAPVLGTLLHETMRLVYLAYQGKLIDQKIISGLRQDKHIDNCIKEAFRTKYFKSDKSDEDFSLEGRNIIVYEVIKKLVIQILIKDAERVPFTILEMEKKFEYLIPASDGDIRISGIIDRIDLQEGRIFIIDYKTGMVNMSCTSIESLFDSESQNRNKHILQTLIYSYLYRKNANTDYPVIPSLYATRNIFNADFTNKISLKHAGEKPEEVNDFRKIEGLVRENLELVVSDIFNPHVPFSQTKDDEKCKFCPYKRICHREIRSNGE